MIRKFTKEKNEVRIMNKHKVFISYYHEEDQEYKDALLEMNDKHDVFVDESVHQGEIDDDGLSAEDIRCIIRDDYIKDATVLILLCGGNSRKRKHIDWELHAAMFNTDKNPKLGILVINLPKIGQGLRAGSGTDEEKDIISPDSSWNNISSRKEYEDRYPYMPARIIDNFVKNVPISVVNWNVAYNEPESLKLLIDIAFKNRKTNEYDHSTPLRKNNT